VVPLVQRFSHHRLTKSEHSHEICHRDRKSSGRAYVPDLPGCVAAADTLDEIKLLMQQGIEFHLEGMREDGDPIPEPTTQVDYAEVA
jgi:predicted RNase H-like HicB family nuclease